MRRQISAFSMLVGSGLLFNVDYLLIITYKKAFALAAVAVSRPLGRGLFMNSYYFLIMML